MEYMYIIIYYAKEKYLGYVDFIFADTPDVCPNLEGAFLIRNDNSAISITKHVDLCDYGN